MRRRMLASLAKSGYTAKDYVQEGLVFNLDGIENQGYGNPHLMQDVRKSNWLEYDSVEIQDL